MTLLQRPVPSRVDSFLTSARGSKKAQHRSRAPVPDFSDSDADDELVSHALQLLEIALHTNHKNPVLARRVANARKSFYADTAMRSSLCKDMGSFCKALQEAFQNSRAADAYCVEFMTDALRLALQHERQDLPFRMTIFSELCYHARRHDFVFDTLLSLAEQCRDAHERCDYYRYLLRGPADTREHAPSVIVAMLTTISQDSYPKRARHALALLHDVACTSPSEFAYNVTREEALPQLVHCFSQQVQQGDEDTKQQLITILDKVLQCAPLSEGEPEDMCRLAEAHAQTQALISASLPRELLYEGVLTVLRSVLATPVNGTPAFYLLRDAAWLQECKTESTTATPSCRTVSTTGGLQLPLTSRALLPTVRLLKTLCTSQLPAVQEVAARCDAAAALAAVMLLQPMSANCSIAGQAIEAAVASSSVAMTQALFCGPVNMLALVDALPDTVTTTGQTHRTACAAAKVRIVHAMAEQLRNKATCLQLPPVLCDAPTPAAEPMALSPLAVPHPSVCAELDDRSSLSPCSVLLSSSSVGDALSPCTSLELSPRADELAGALFQGSSGPSPAPSLPAPSQTPAPKTSVQVLEEAVSANEDVWSRLLECTAEYRKHLGQHLCWDGKTQYPTRAERQSMFQMPRFAVPSPAAQAAVPAQPPQVDLEAVDLGVQLSVPVKASTGGEGDAVQHKGAVVVA